MIFNPQLFGENDTITSSEQLQFDFGFSDGDNRKQNIPNPRDNITEAEIIAFDAWIKANAVIIGDKYGADTTGVNSAVIINTTRRKLDIS